MDRYLILLLGRGICGFAYNFVYIMKFSLTSISLILNMKQMCKSNMVPPPQSCVDLSFQDLQVLGEKNVPDNVVVPSIYRFHYTVDFNDALQ